jgi:hypothetical protein
MEQLNQQAEILELGRKIVKELSPDGNDRLSLLEKWMGHYIAELILRIESEDNELVKNKLQKECFKTILKLWEKRYSLASEIMPLNRIKSAVYTLSELKKTRSMWDRMRNSDETSWEGAALQIHDNYMDILKICLQVSIAQDALGKEKAWVDEFGALLSDEEKEIVNELESFLNNSKQTLTFIIDGDKTEVESDNDEKDRMTRTFDRLESILEDQKEIIEKLKKKSLYNKE